MTSHNPSLAMTCQTTSDITVQERKAKINQEWVASEIIFFRIIAVLSCKFTECPSNSALPAQLYVDGNYKQPLSKKREKKNRKEKKRIQSTILLIYNLLATCNCYSPMHWSLLLTKNSSSADKIVSVISGSAVTAGLRSSSPIERVT